MFCENCGQQVSNSAKFCNKCGAQLNHTENVSKSNTSHSSNQSVVQIDNVALGKFTFGIISAIAWMINLFIVFFAPLIKNTMRDEGISLIEWFFDFEIIGACISSCADGEFTMSYQIISFFYILVLISVLIISFSLIDTKGQVETSSKIASSCCLAVALLSLLMFDEFDSKKYKVTGWFFAILALYIFVFIFLDFSKNIRPIDSLSTTSEDKSDRLVIRAFPKHISTQYTYQSDIPTVNDFEELIDNSNLKEHLIKTHPNNQFYISLHQYIYSKFKEMINTSSTSNMRRFSYNDSKNSIDITLKYGNHVLECEILVNM